MRVSTSQLYATNLAGLSKQNADIAKLQQQLGSGSKLLSPSDNPADATRLVNIDRAIDRNEQFKINGDFASNRLRQSETTLSAVADGVERINGLVFSSLAKDATSRAQLAVQLRDELSVITDLANTRDANGDYLYAGHDVNTEPFDDSGANVVYSGDANQRSIQIADGRRVSDGNSGEEIFENLNGGRSLFRMIEDFITVLENPLSTPTAIETANDTATTDLVAAKDKLTTVRNSIVSRIGMIENEQQINIQMTRILKDQRSEINDVDLTEIALQLQQLQVSLQAAQQTFVKVQELSLFNFI
ncbi:MAG: flagellar hook-associated protein FlgL [Gammaproteobacteria bacterium]